MFLFLLTRAWRGPLVVRAAALLLASLTEKETSSHPLEKERRVSDSLYRVNDNERTLQGRLVKLVYMIVLLMVCKCKIMTIL